MNVKRFAGLTIVLSTLLPAACGGGGNPASPTPPPPDPDPDPGAAPPPEGTFIRGTVVDTNAFVEDGSTVPIAGVIVQFLGEAATATSDDRGVFVLDNLAPGEKVIDFDTTNAQSPDGGVYAGFREAITLQEGANDIARPFYLPRIAAGSLTTVDPNIDTVVTNAELGVSLTVLANSARGENGELFEGELSISEVPDGLAPAALPEDLDPGLLFTVQPVGVTFDPPATLSISNERDSWPDGSQIDFWSLDPDLGVFSIVGEGLVIGDSIETVSGGVRAADWHAPLPPPVDQGDTPDDNDGDCQGEACCKPCKAKFGSFVQVANGRFTEQIELPSYFSLGVERTLTLVYASDRAYPVEAMVVAPALRATTPVPNDFTYRGFLDGVDQGYDITLDASMLNTGEEQSFRIVLPLDGSDLQTDAYVGQARVTSRYDATNITGRLFEDVNIVNDIQSPVGAGWRIGGVDRMYSASAGGLLLVDGRGDVVRFRESSGSGSLVTFIAPTTAASQVTQVQALLDDIGVPYQTRSISESTVPQISPTDIADTALFVAIGTNGVGLFGFQSMPEEDKRNVLDTLEQGVEQGVPYLILGDDIGPRESTLEEADLVRYERLTGIRRDTAEEPRGGFFGSRGFWRLIDPTQPIFNGPFGAFTIDPNSPFPDGLGEDSDYSRSTDQRANLGEVVLVEEYLDGENANSVDSEILNDQAVFLSEYPSGARGLTITANLPSQGQTIDPNIGFLLQNAVDWLTTGITAPGALVSPSGDFSVVTVNDDGSTTRRLPSGLVYEFDPDGYLQSKADRNGNAETYEYDAEGRLVAREDPLGMRTTFTYQNGRLSSITDPANRISSFAMDAQGNLIQVELPDGSVREYGYDDRHLLTRQTNTRGETTDYEYNEVGHAIRSTGPDGSVITLAPSQSIGLGEADD
ncbi:MAG: hypothetical protein AAGA68_10590 [Pseudomonadota bacterium]